jgi:predicted AAA+ superfamily ATPase
VLVEQNKHWQNIRSENGVPRTILEKSLSYMDNDFIISICGVRRAGKSTLLKQMINHLVYTRQIDPRNILSVNLEDPVFNFYKDDVRNLEKIFQDYLKLQNPTDRVYLFLDEVQFFKDWQVFVKSKYEKKGIKIIVTGSNSRLLSAELVTLLSGRTLVVNVMPFSFKEILRADGLETSNTVELLAHSNRIKKRFDEYLQYGGFPQVVFEKNREIKSDILKNYYTNIFYNDIVPRFDIKKSDYAEKLLYYLITNVSTPISYNNLANVVALSDKTIKEYITYFSQSMLLFTLDRFSPSVKKQIAGSKKVYSIDNGLVNAVAFKISENFGPLFENIVAIELLRREERFFYYQTPLQKEVDFFIPQSEEKLVQVCADLANDKTRKREITLLKAVMRETSIKNSILITLDEENLIQEEDLEIKIMPAWKFFSFWPPKT